MRYKTFVINLKQRKDRLEKTKNVLRKAQFDDKDYTIFEAIYGENLDEKNSMLLKLFAGNDFNSRKNVIGCALSHLTLWKELCESNYDAFLIFEDDFVISNNLVKDNIGELCETKSHLLFLGIHQFYHWEETERKIEELKLDNYMGGTFAYIITKDGAKILLDAANNYGIKHGIDYWMVRVDGIISKFLTDLPVKSGTVDTDIQNSYSSFNLLWDWKFIPNRDHMNDDIAFYRGNPELIAQYILQQNLKVNMFNTSGFIKFGKVNLTKTHNLENSGGLFVNGEEKLVYPMCNWTDCENLIGELTKMMIRLPDQKIIFVDSPEIAEYFLIINYPLSSNYNDKKTVVIQLEPHCDQQWQSYGTKTWCEWENPDPEKFLRIITPRTELLPGFWQITIPPENVTENKLNRISIILSRKFSDPGHKLRVEFCRYIEDKNDPDVQLDVFGTHNYHCLKSYRGTVKNKEDCIHPYKYYLSVENNCEKNYITEKFYEPILCETCPIYYGCTNISEFNILSNACFILPLEDFEESFKKLKNGIIEDIYNHKIYNIKECKKFIIEEHNIFSRAFQ